MVRETVVCTQELYVVGEIEDSLIRMIPDVTITGQYWPRTRQRRHTFFRVGSKPVGSTYCWVFEAEGLYFFFPTLDSQTFIGLAPVLRHQGDYVSFGKPGGTHEHDGAMRVHALKLSLLDLIKAIESRAPERNWRWLVNALSSLMGYDQLKRAIYEHYDQLAIQAIDFLRQQLGPDAEELLEVAGKAAEWLLEIEGVYEVYLYGSLARWLAGEREVYPRDVDLLIVCNRWVLNRLMASSPAYAVGLAVLGGEPQRFPRVTVGGVGLTVEVTRTVSRRYLEQRIRQGPEFPWQRARRFYFSISRSMFRYRRGEGFTPAPPPPGLPRPC